MATDSWLWAPRNQWLFAIITPPRPMSSSKDVEMTKTLASSLKMMDIAMYDHFVIGSNNIYNFKMNGHAFD